MSQSKDERLINITWSLFSRSQAGQKEKVSRLFGEGEWAPQQPSALGSSAVCGRTETKNLTGPIPNLPAV